MKSPNSYSSAGVDTYTEDKAMPFLWKLFRSTLGYNKDLVENIPLEDHYAAVIKLDDNKCVAIKTDGVGTKTFIAQLMDKYDTVGIDCIAMNVNDVICIGAKPTTFVDYLALHKADQSRIEEIMKGLARGADIAKVSIVGGETAIMPEMVNSAVYDRGFDLAGCCIGIVDPSSIVVGDKIKDGDVLIGIASSGIHSNGLTLARKALDAGKNVHRYYDELGRTLGEELLEPSLIYIQEIMQLITENIDIKLVSHVTSHGLSNLRRTSKNYGYIIDYLPEPPPIFGMVQREGGISISEMYRVFNMGIGMCVCVPKEEAELTLGIIEKRGKKAFMLGKAVRDAQRKVVLNPKKIYI
jgi:phosphoribosylformylglycinamidine cyclo-ligase